MIQALDMIHQGHLYSYGSRRVLALETSDGTERVRVLDESNPSGLGRAFGTHAMYLTPLPMRYFGGQIPRAET